MPRPAAERERPMFSPRARRGVPAAKRAGAGRGGLSPLRPGAANSPRPPPTYPSDLDEDDDLPHRAAGGAKQPRRARAREDVACGHEWQRVMWHAGTPRRAASTRVNPVRHPRLLPHRHQGGRRAPWSDAPRRPSSPPWSGATRARVLSCAQRKPHARPGPRSRLVLAIARLRRRRPQGATVFSILLSAGSSSVLSVSRLTPHAGVV